MAKKENIADTNNKTLYLNKVYINEMEIYPTDIKSVVVKEWIFDVIPTIELMIHDNGLFNEKVPLEDNTIIKVELGRTQKSIPIIVAEFTLLDFVITNVDPEKINSSIINITGILKSRKLLTPILNRSFKQKKSIDVMTDIMTECGFEIKKTKINSADLMTWYQINLNNMDMIKHLLSKSYIAPGDMLFAYVDRHNIFNIKSLKDMVEMDTNILEIRHDILKMLDLETNKVYFNTFNYKNISSSLNKKLGYGINYNFYNLEENKEYKIIGDEHKLTDFSFKNKNEIEHISRQMNFQIKFKEDNTHINYLSTQIQNQYLLETFFSANLLIYVNATNNINIGDKINLVMPAMISEGDNEIKDINETYSGEYIVGGIFHQLSGGGEYVMGLSLFRNGINKNSYSESDEIQLNKIQKPMQIIEDF